MGFSKCVKQGLCFCVSVLQRLCGSAELMCSSLKMQLHVWGSEIQKCKWQALWLVSLVSRDMSTILERGNIVDNMEEVKKSKKKTSFLF